MALNFLILQLIFLPNIFGFKGVFWHICDTHLNSSYASDINGGNGDYKSDSPFKLIKSAIRFMRNTYPNPGFIIINGDNAYHGRPPRDKFMESLSNTSDLLRSQFPKTIILPSLGNHDLNPANLLGLNSTWCSNLYEIWKTFFINASESDINTFKKGCFYSRIIDPEGSKTLVIVLNTILWYKGNTNVRNEVDPFEQFIWLENKLKNARSQKYKVFLVAHAPPGASEYTPQIYEHLYPKFNSKFLAIMLNYSDVIDAGFFAHQHTDAFKIVYNSEGQPEIPLLLSPSVSPMNLFGLGSINPSVRLYIWNETASQSKYYQYHTELSNNLNWLLEYNSSELLSNLSAVSFHALLLDLESTESKNFDKFFKYHLSGRPHGKKDCFVNSICRCRINCGMRNIDYPALHECLNKCPDALSHLAILYFIIPIIIIFVCIVVMMLIKMYNHRKVRYKYAPEDIQ